MGNLKREHGIIIEPLHEKTKNSGFRPGPTQTGLYSHRSRLEARYFGVKTKRNCTNRVAKHKDADQLRSNCEADQRLCFRYTQIVGFLMQRFT